jgi:hypothetical protein
VTEERNVLKHDLPRIISISFSVCDSKERKLEDFESMMITKEQTRF